MKLNELEWLGLFDGICSDKPRAGKSPRRGVEGTDVSSLVVFFVSQSFGEGANDGCVSDNDRALDRDLAPFLTPSASADISFTELPRPTSPTVFCDNNWLVN
jgi:hypothetical protein